MNAQVTPILTPNNPPPKKPDKTIPIVIIGLFILVSALGYFLWKKKHENINQGENHTETNNQTNQPTAEVNEKALFPDYVGKNSDSAIVWGKKDGKNPAFTSKLAFTHEYNLNGKRRQ